MPIDRPHVPTPEEVGDGIVRMNCGNDSNNQRDLVIETAKRYQRYFFNTSIPRFDFPGPVVLTANPKEEQEGSYAMPNRHGDDWLAGRQPDVRAAPHSATNSGSGGQSRGRLDSRPGAGGDYLHGLLRPRAAGAGRT